MVCVCVSHPGPFCQWADTQWPDTRRSGHTGRKLWEILLPKKTFLKINKTRVDKYLNFASLRMPDQRVIIYEKQAESFDVRG